MGIGYDLQTLLELYPVIHRNLLRIALWSEDWCGRLYYAAAVLTGVPRSEQLAARATELFTTDRHRRTRACKTAHLDAHAQQVCHAYDFAAYDRLFPQPAYRPWPVPRTTATPPPR